MAPNPPPSHATNVPANRSGWRIALLFAAAAATVFMPLLILDGAVFAGNSDALFYTIILKLTAQQMTIADWLPGWMANANGGMGSPVGYYYPPLASQLTSLLGLPIAGSDPSGVKRLVLGLFFTQWLGGIAAWCWLSRHFSARAALVASLLFILFPYKWVYVYLHVNLAQLWALVWIPPLMMAAEDIVRGKRAAWAWYGVWLALLALTHPRTLVAFSAVPALYALTFSPGRRVSAVAALAAAHALGALLSAYYWLPALLNLDLVQTSLANTGRMVYSDNLSHHDLLLNFHYAVLAALVIGLYQHLPPPVRGAIRSDMTFWLLALLIVTFLCTRLSLFLWDHIAPLQFLQFPVARLHAVALAAACVLSALFVEYGRDAPRLKMYSPGVLLAAVAAMTVMTLAYVHKIYGGAHELNWDYVDEIHASNVILPPEYRTKWQPADTNAFHAAESAGTQPLVAIIHGTGTAEAAWRNGKILAVRAVIKSPEAALRIKQLYWPYRQPSAGHALEPGADGLTTLRLPRGAHDVTLTLKPISGETEGQMISLLAWILAGIILYRQTSTPAATP